MIAGILKRVTSLSFWGALSAFFSLLVSSGAYVLGAIIVLMLFGVVAIMFGPQFVSAA